MLRMLSSRKLVGTLADSDTARRLQPSQALDGARLAVLHPTSIHEWMIIDVRSKGETNNALACA